MQIQPHGGLLLLWFLMHYPTNLTYNLQLSYFEVTILCRGWRKYN